MDTGFLNFNEEHFSFDYLDQINYEDNTNTSSTTAWHDDELPGCSFFSNIKDITETLPSDFFNIDVINGDPDSLPPLFDSSIRMETSPSSLPSPSSASISSLSTNDDFYLTNYRNEPLNQQQTNQTTIKRTIKAAVKKIDKEACKYIIEDDDKDKDDENDSCNNDDLVDVVTVSEDESPTVLEASDPLGLLEQFEASEKSSSSIIQQLKQSLNSTNNNDNNNNTNDNSHDIDFLEKIPPNPIQIFADDNNITNRLENNDGNNNNINNITTVAASIETEKDNSINTRQQINKLSNNIVNNNNNSKNQQIRDALPQELIARINESGKRKTITVIPPIPNKKRCNNSRTFEAIQRSKINKLINQHNVMNDHDYCKASSSSSLSSSSCSSSVSTPTTAAIAAVYPKEPKKDSGFESTEEDEQQPPSIRNQPVIKNEDGKLMVSLLKVNTITNNSSNGSSSSSSSSNNTNNNDNNTQKKKLKLEEYKKRRPITTSQSNSPMNSACNSPVPEDENLKRIKHQEKLMKMAEELLNTPPKSALSPLKTTNDDDKDNKQIIGEKIKENNVQLVEDIPQPPPDMEMKSFVSVGINTEIHSDQNLLRNIDELNEIQPLLQKVSHKINSNSFITSLIENLPKVKRKTTINDEIKEPQIDQDKLESIRENLVVVWLPKDRPIKKTVDTEIQTTITLIGEETQSRYRRRLISSDSDDSILSSSSSSSSRSSSLSVSSKVRYSRKRHRSRSMSSSNSSRSRSRSKSRSRSRQSKIYKKQKRNHITAEHVAEVEERRVIYVGRLEDGLKGDDLIRKFKHFGPITHASVHPRKNGESFGFVTFANKEDAYEAVEHGNDVYGYEKYDLSFGGRRIFCQTNYSDLDDMKEDDYNYYHISKENEESFDSLLRAFLALRKRKP